MIAWAAAQPWCDGNVGGMGISYFAIAQLAAAAQRPPHLRAIFPFATMDDLYDAVLLAESCDGVDPPAGIREWQVDWPDATAWLNRLANALERD